MLADLIRRLHRRVRDYYIKRLRSELPSILSGKTDTDIELMVWGNVLPRGKKEAPDA